MVPVKQVSLSLSTSEWSPWVSLYSELSSLVLQDIRAKAAGDEPGDAPNAHHAQLQTGCMDSLK